ncbi:MAG: DJ-1/PfpI family protein [Clostridia bacterium]|nr:DJ-1/PfpI family protein [Clostridia bacterium]
MVILFLADGFEEIEALATVDILRRCGIDVKTVSVSNSNAVMGAHHIPVVADLRMPEILDITPTAVILPGGLPGADNLEASKEVNQKLDECYKNGGLVAAICAAPKVLGAAGLLKGKCAVCYPGFEDKLLGATALTDRVCVCENVITSRGAGTSHDFAFAIAKWLEKEDAAFKIRKGMLYDE